MTAQVGKVIVVGISGTTNSGKTTIVRKLKEKLPTAVSICQDYYFLPPGDPRLAPIAIPELNHHNWEDYRALEMDKMVTHTKKLISHLQQTSDKTQVVFIDGFSIFGWRPLANLLDLKYFLSVEKEVCADRRKTREYNPPDKPGYFEQYVWPMHLKHLELIKDQADIVYLESDSSMEDKVLRICKDIETRVQSV